MIRRNSVPLDGSEPFEGALSIVGDLAKGMEVTMVIARRAPLIAPERHRSQSDGQT